LFKGVDVAVLQRI